MRDEMSQSRIFLDKLHHLNKKDTGAANWGWRCFRGCYCWRVGTSWNSRYISLIVRASSSKSMGSMAVGVEHMFNHLTPLVTSCLLCRLHGTWIHCWCPLSVYVYLVRRPSPKWHPTCDTALNTVECYDTYEAHAHALTSDKRSAWLWNSHQLMQKLALQQILSSIVLSYRTDSTDSRTNGPSKPNDFTLLNGWICLHGVLD